MSARYPQAARGPFQLMRLALTALAMVVLVAGCVTSTRMPTYVVEFTLTNTYGSTLGVSEYPHCGTSELHDGYLKVDSPRPPGGALVHIDPRFEGQFAVIGSEPMARGLDHEVRVPDGIEDTDFAVVTLLLRNGALLIDGFERTLPYTGTITVPGWWNATYTVSEGPGVVRVDHRSYSCA